MMRFLWWTAIACAVVLGIAGGLEMQNGPAKNTAPAPQSTPAQLSKAQGCRKALKSITLLRHYEWDGAYAAVEIGPAFYAADYDNKNALNLLVLCVATEGRMDDTISSVEYLDWRTHKSVARWSKYTGMKVEEAE